MHEQIFQFANISILNVFIGLILYWLFLISCEPLSEQKTIFDTADVLIDWDAPL